MELNLKKEGTYTYDAVSLGEIMLRLDPGEGRIRTARSFRAWEGGGEYNVVRGLRKCFGLKTIKALSAPFGMVKFMPTGGIDASNLSEYLSSDKIVYFGGSWMVKGYLVKAKEFDKIEALTKEAVELVKKIRG